MNRIWKKHIELLEAVNNASSESEHLYADAKLHGFRDALDLFDYNQLMDCDHYYLNQGIDRPMCCGVFLDWKPE